ncbi:hypothetical protein B0T16DRAFT_450642 [Cercophora newfieldiana]|uniref:N-acetyltransferase domain-containing protein n=1 Tax=Cercophora newfieldiana TaxID=92897 RepID=A0AA40CXD4_9PEZI|nr:hypothetical protein B0T16DRAFT_450642 [Cercophora newfieldiana]
MEVRTATFSDSQPISNLLLTALSSEPQWQYLFPDRHAHTSAHASRINSVVAHCLNSPTDWTITIAEDPKTKTPLSVAVWSTCTPGAEPSPTAYTDILSSCGPEDGTKPSHAAAYLAAISRGREKYFTGFGPRLHLYLIATHPRQQGRGYAQALVAWGLKKAAEQKVAASTLVSAKGYVFFSGLGFKDVGLMQVVGEGEEGREELVVKVMVNTSGRDRRPSVLRFLGLE